MIRLIFFSDESKSTIANGKITKTAVISYSHRSTRLTVGTSIWNFCSMISFCTNYTDYTIHGMQTKCLKSIINDFASKYSLFVFIPFIFILYEILISFNPFSIHFLLELILLFLMFLTNTSIPKCKETSYWCINHTFKNSLFQLLGSNYFK